MKRFDRFVCFLVSLMVFQVHYEPFYSDFGPLNLSVLYRFSEYVHGIIMVSVKNVLLETDDLMRV